MHLKAFPGVVRQFWDHIGDGMSPADAGVAVGVSLHTGRKWFAHAGGVRPKFPDDGPRKRPRLTQEERIEIDAGVKAEKSIRDIADRLGRHPSTIMREIDRNAFSYGRYRIGRSIGSGRRRKAAGTPSRAIVPPGRRHAPRSGRAARNRASWPPMRSCRCGADSVTGKAQSRADRSAAAVGFFRRDGDAGVPRNHLPVDLRAGQRELAP